MSHTVVVIDDHEIVRRGIRRTLEGRGVIVGEAGTVADARRLVAETRPDVAVVDVVLPDGDGVQLCREILGDYPGTACVLLTSFPERRAMLSAVIAGASAYLPKDGTAADLVRTVRAAARGDRLLDESEVTRLLDELAEGRAEGFGLQDLTGQERRVFELIGQGLSNRQIAAQMHLAERTVKNYASRMLQKLDMDRRTEAAVLAARLAERRAQRDARGVMED